MVNINLSERLITLKFSLRIVVIGFHIIEMAERPIFTTSLINSFSNLVLFTLSALSLVVLLWALKMAFNLSLIFFI